MTRLELTHPNRHSWDRDHPFRQHQDADEWHIRRTVEQPDIIPRNSRIWRIPQLPTGPAAAVRLFSVLTLLRSRKHRVLLAFYWGAGAAIIYAIANAGSPTVNGIGDHRAWQAPTETYLMASVLLVGVAVGAVRSVLALPISAKAEWFFRITEFENSVSIEVRHDASWKRSHYALSGAFLSGPRCTVGQAGRPSFIRSILACSESMLVC